MGAPPLLPKSPLDGPGGEGVAEGGLTLLSPGLSGLEPASPLSQHSTSGPALPSRDMDAAFLALTPHATFGSTPGPCRPELGAGCHGEVRTGPGCMWRFALIGVGGGEGLSTTVPSARACPTEEDGSPPWCPLDLSGALLPCPWSSCRKASPTHLDIPFSPGFPDYPFVSDTQQNVPKLRPLIYTTSWCREERGLGQQLLGS